MTRAFPIMLALLLGFFSSHSQERRGTYFGVQFKPMISGSLINEGVPSGTENGINFEVTKQFGFSAGMVIRHDFTKMFSVESGISFVQRNQNYHVYDPVRDYTFDQEFGTVGYEIPLLGLVYIQLSDQVFMNTSFGVSFDMYPSDIKVESDDDRVNMIGQRAGWILPALSANIGWEWRTKENGSFYIGGTYHRSFGDTYEFIAEYDYNRLDTASVVTPMYLTTNGNYLTLDFRYFFHEDPEKKQLRKDKSRRRR
ncbi:hypothetical protein KFE98_11565 [bacterium SCSIO 12741]|nr:hypothetical protein KFE98_11565 [bacterium SCSIO 12741]